MTLLGTETCLIKHILLLFNLSLTQVCIACTFSTVCHPDRQKFCAPVDDILMSRITKALTAGLGINLHMFVSQADFENR